MALHDWILEPAEARRLQQALAARLDCHDRLGPVRHVAGIDVGFLDGGRTTRAAAVVLDAGDLSLRDHARVLQPTRFPYVPGLLSFRELPAVLDAIGQLEQMPDLILCDGQGIAHPRRLGIAAHLGLWLELPTIGVAKSRLIGEHDRVPEGRGEWTPLVDDGVTVGAVLRTRAGVRPVYVSPGHRISLETAIDWVMRCVTRYRLPETTRAADRLASRGRL